VILDFRSAAELEGDVARVPMIIAEVILDDFALISEAQHEFLVPVLRVNLHDVPQNRTPSDWHHRLGTEFRFLAQARPQPTA
jgi:hypothetical protein